MKSQRLAKLLYRASVFVEDNAERLVEWLHTSGRRVDPSWKPLPPMTMTEAQREMNRAMSKMLFKACEAIYDKPYEVMLGRTPDATKLQAEAKG